jgi:putative endonuclease
MQVERPALLVFIAYRYNIDMYYVYVLKNLKSSFLYVGCTNDMKRRLEEHNSNQSGYTSLKGDWKVIYCECYKSKKDAIHREKMLKLHGSAYGHLKKRILNSINEG